eukprot:s894_g29.t1
MGCGCGKQSGSEPSHDDDYSHCQYDDNVYRRKNATGAPSRQPLKPKAADVERVQKALSQRVEASASAKWHLELLAVSAPNKPFGATGCSCSKQSLSERRGDDGLPTLRSLPSPGRKPLQPQEEEEVEKAQKSERVQASASAKWHLELLAVSAKKKNVCLMCCREKAHKAETVEVSCHASAGAKWHLELVAVSVELKRKLQDPQFVATRCDLDGSGDLDAHELKQAARVYGLSDSGSSGDQDGPTDLQPLMAGKARISKKQFAKIVASRQGNTKLIRAFDSNRVEVLLGRRICTHS